MVTQAVAFRPLFVVSSIFVLSLLVLLFLSACTVTETTVSRAFSVVGKPASGIAGRSPLASDEFGSSISGEMRNDVARLIVASDGPSCDIYYFVGGSETVTGFMLLGDRCTVYGTHPIADRYAQPVLIPNLAGEAE